MMKWLLLAVVVLLALWWIGRSRRDGRAPPDTPAAGEPGSAKPGAEPSARGGPEPMVACSHCGLLLPQAESIADEHGALRYCCAAHRQAGPRDGS